MIPKQAITVCVMPPNQKFIEASVHSWHPLCKDLEQSVSTQKFISSFADDVILDQFKFAKLLLIKMRI